MEISVVLFVVFNLNLVLTEDNVLVETNLPYQDKPVVEAVDDSQIDQIAESSQAVRQTYNNGGSGNDPNQFDGRKNGGEVYDGHNQQVIQNSDGLSHEAPNNLEILQPALTQVYPQQGQPIYVQYPIQPIRIFGAQAAPLYQNQQHESESQTLGYSSYVEHVSPKDEEEIKSALKEGSVSDIKRLVPKSGISFKIYNNEKNSLENSKTQTEYSKLQHTIKTDLPPVQHNHFQTVYKPTADLESLQQTYQQHGYDNSHLLQSDNAASHPQERQPQTHYFTQPEVTPQKSYLDIKSSTLVKPFKINVDENNKATSTAEYNSLVVNRGTKHGLSDFSSYPKQWSYDVKSEGSQKAVKKIKPAVIQYEIDPVALAERNKMQYTQAQDVGQSYNIQAQKARGSVNYQNSYSGKVNQNGYLAKKDKNVKNRGNYENVNQAQSYLGANADPQVYKSSQSEYHPATTSYVDNEPAKSSQHIITHIENSQNFDHQKALEGSTSFDIKNAIDATGSLTHQTNHPTPDIHSFNDIKQQLAYVIPKIPTSAVVLDSGAHESPIVEGHHIKNFGLSTPLSYHTVPEVSGKFFHTPQTVVWSSEHLKQGNALTANDLHQPLIKLHLPKEEFYHHKTPNVELPTSSISHVSYQQKQPYVLHYDAPFVKHLQEIHFQQKPKIRIQNQVGNLKLGQPLAIDWSLFKSNFPNFNINNIAIKPELTSHIQDTGKKIVPILIRKRKNRSNNKQEIGMVVYGKVNNKRRPTKPAQRQEKNFRVNLQPEASNNVNHFEPKGDRKNEFSVSASYKVDRSFKTQ